MPRGRRVVRLKNNAGNIPLGTRHAVPAGTGRIIQSFRSSFGHSRQSAPCVLSQIALTLVFVCGCLALPTLRTSLPARPTKSLQIYFSSTVEGGPGQTLFVPSRRTIPRSTPAGPATTIGRRSHRRRRSRCGHQQNRLVLITNTTKTRWRRSTTRGEKSHRHLHDFHGETAKYRMPPRQQDWLAYKPLMAN